MNAPIALHQVTVLPSSPSELVGIAAELACQGVCVFVHVPRSLGAGRPVYPQVSADNLAQVRARLLDLGLRVTNLEYFPLTEHTVLEDFKPALELGALLGAQRVVAHVHDSNEARATDTLGRLVDLAGRFSLQVGLEFMGLSAGCPSLAQAARLVAQVGTPGLGIGVDPLHLARTGATPSDLAALPPWHFAYVQLCDGDALRDTRIPPAREAYVAEAFDRRVPGQGDFPLIDILRALPPELPIDVEVPALHVRTGRVSPLAHARAAVAGARRVIQAARHTASDA